MLRGRKRKSEPESGAAPVLFLTRPPLSLPGVPLRNIYVYGRPITKPLPNPLFGSGLGREAAGWAIVRLCCGQQRGG